MDQLSLLTFLSFGMLVGSYLAGSIPMIFKLSDTKSRLLALLGSGILVGTALAIIIPEGINSLTLDRSTKIGNTVDLNKTQQNNTNNYSTNPCQAEGTEAKTALWVIGPSLITGFVLMLIIDQLSLYLSSVSSVNNQSEQKNHYQLTPQKDTYECSIDTNEDDDEDEEIDLFKALQIQPPGNPSTCCSKRQDKTVVDVDSLLVESGNHTARDDNSQCDSRSLSALKSVRPIKPKVTPTLGLVIHAAADGIALGAAATTSHKQVELIIFLAIMLHKGPAAFSLVVFLIHMGLKHSTIKKHLLVFSSSAPIAALVTFFGLSQSSKEALRETNATGVAMLFSAGTFLYVATVHVLPELLNHRPLNRREFVCLIIGSFLPMVLASEL